MFLSPILILALLFSSCDDNSGKAAPEEVTLTISATSPTITGENIADNDEIKITEAPSELENATSTNVTIKKTSDSWTVSGEIKLPKGATFSGTSLSWSEQSLSVASGATVTAVTLNGTAGGEGNALTFAVTGGTITASPKEPAPEAKTVTVTGTVADASMTAGTKIASSESFTVTAAPDGLEDATEVSIQVSYDGTNYTVSGSLKTATDLTSKTELKWESLSGISTDTMNVTALTLTGSFASDTFTVASGSYTAASK